MSKAAKKIMGHSPRVKALAAFLDKQPDAARFKFSENVAMYKIENKIFAILSAKAGYVVLKCDPDRIEVLKATYSGVGHRTHLDRRYWIAIETDADVPAKEIEWLAKRSYTLARETAPGKAKAKRAKKAPLARKAI